MFSPMKNLKGFKALVVEDDRIIQSVIKANLESIGIPAVIAGNGVEAIQATLAAGSDPRAADRCEGDVANRGLSRRAGDRGR